MVSKKELLLAYKSNSISTAEKNLRKYNRAEKLRKRKQRKIERNDKQETELQKANPDSNYKIPHFYRTGEEKIIPGSDFAEGIIPPNIKTQEIEKTTLLQRIKKIFQKA